MYIYIYIEISTNQREDFSFFFCRVSDIGNAYPSTDATKNFMGLSYRIVMITVRHRDQAPHERMNEAPQLPAVTSDFSYENEGRGQSAQVAVSWT